MTEPITHHPEAPPKSPTMFPLSEALGLKVVHAGPGFDSLELEKALGASRYASLMKGVKNVFACNHAEYPKDHPLSGHEVLCVYGKDLEAFLKAGG